MTFTKTIHAVDLSRLGLTYKQLDYWTRCGHLIADNPTPGSGRRRSWAPEELAVAARMGRLVKAGLTVPTAARVARIPNDLLEIGDGVYVLVLDPPSEEFEPRPIEDLSIAGGVL